MPDPPHWSKQARHRRAASEPRIELSTWVRTLARRVEAQVSRDWVFGFTSWNLLFRSSLNLSRTTDAYSRTYYDEDENAWVQPTGHHVETAAKQLLDALRGSYIDVNGHPRAVKGDVTKLQYVPRTQTYGAQAVEEYASYGTRLAGHARSKEAHAF